MKAGNERRDVLVEPLTCISLILIPLGAGGRGAKSIGTRLFTGRPSSHSQALLPPPLTPRGSRSRSNCLRECLPEFVHNMNLVGRFIAVHFASVPSRNVRFCSVLLTHFSLLSCSNNHLRQSCDDTKQPFLVFELEMSQNSSAKLT